MKRMYCIESLLDIDAYKLFMLQFIWLFYRNVSITFALKNRTKRVKLGKVINRERLISELKHCTTLRFTDDDLEFIQRKKPGVFRADFIEFLRTFQLTQCWTIDIEDDQLVLEFTGPWTHVTLWEIYALSIVNELRVQNTLERMDNDQQEKLYFLAENRLRDDLQMIADGNVRFVEFGTRRRHSREWQEESILLAKAMCPGFLGTSNVFLAKKYDLSFDGTLAHELTMVISALASVVSDNALQQSQYDVLTQWEQLYGQDRRIILPDTFGTTQFLKNAPASLYGWRGVRLDSKDPRIGGEEVIQWWLDHGENPKEKTLMPSDGLTAPLMVDLEKQYGSRTNVIQGWGTMMTNNFAGLYQEVMGGEVDELEPISLVCKVSQVIRCLLDQIVTIWTVKLSDNPEKAMGPHELVQRYLRVFGWEGFLTQEVTV